MKFISDATASYTIPQIKTCNPFLLISLSLELNMKFVMYITILTKDKNMKTSLCNPSNFRV